MLQSKNQTLKVSPMQVKREFPPEIARKLEHIQLPALEDFLEQVPDNQEEIQLTDWQIKGLKEAEASVNAGRGIPFEKVEQWMKSWFSENELPVPKCE